MTAAEFKIFFGWGFINDRLLLDFYPKTFLPPLTMKRNGSKEKGPNEIFIEIGNLMDFYFTQYVIASIFMKIGPNIHSFYLP